MPNIFDQFDAPMQPQQLEQPRQPLQLPTPNASSGNLFDQFDEPSDPPPGPPNVGGLPFDASPVAYSRDSAMASAQEPKPPQPVAPRSMGQTLLDSELNMRLAARQKTDPAVYDGDRPLRKKLGIVYPESDYGPDVYVADGKPQLINREKHVVLIDPVSGEYTAFERNPLARGTDDTEESALKSAGRIISSGLVVGPVVSSIRAVNAAGTAQRAASTAQRAQEATRDLQAFERAQVPVFPPAFGGAATRSTAKGLSETFGVGAPLQNSLQRSQEGAQAATTRVASQMGGSTTAREAGQVVDTALDRFKDARPADVVEDAVRNLPDQRLNEIIADPARMTSLKTKQGALYERAWRQIPDEMQRGRAVEGLTRVMQGPESTRAVLAEIQGRNARMTIQTGQNAAPEAVTRPVQGGLLGRMIEAVNNPRWTANLQTLRDMRSEFRRLASGMADTEKNTLKLSDLDRIQGAITDDMISLLSRNAAAYREAGDIQTAQGFERSIREFQRADRFTRLSMQRMETVEKLFRADSVESLARNITNASMSGSKGNLDLLRTLQRTLQPDEMAEVGSALLSELGRPVASAGGTAQELGFSVNSFMTRWNQMSPQARHILFGGEHSAALDDVVRVVRRLSEVEKYANASNSGRMTMNVGGILAGLSSIATGTGGYALGAAGGGFGLSFLLSRPTTARWLVGYLRLKADPHTTARRLNAYVGQLGQYTQHEPALLPFQRALAEQFGVVEGDAEEQRDQKDVRVPNARQRPEDDLVPFGHGGVITTSPNAMRNFRDAREGNSMRGWR